MHSVKPEICRFSEELAREEIFATPISLVEQCKYLLSSIDDTEKQAPGWKLFPATFIGLAVRKIHFIVKQPAATCIASLNFHGGLVKGEGSGSRGIVTCWSLSLESLNLIPPLLADAGISFMKRIH